MRWRRRKERDPMGPPITDADLAEADRSLEESRRKLWETRQLAREAEGTGEAAREVIHRVDRFTEEMDRSFRRLRHGH